MDGTPSGFWRTCGPRRLIAEERSVLTGEEQPIPKGHRWSDLSAPQMEGARLEDHYRESLKLLGEASGMLGLVFRKQRRLARSDLDDFVKCFNPDDQHQRKATWSEKSPEGRFRPYSYEEIVQRDKANLDIFWLRDESLEDSANLPDPHVLAAEIADDLRSALEQIDDIVADLSQRADVLS